VGEAVPAVTFPNPKLGAFSFKHSATRLLFETKFSLDELDGKEGELVLATLARPEGTLVVVDVEK